jgi:hypothetical protein
MQQEKLFKEMFGKNWEEGSHTSFLQDVVNRYPWFGAAHYFLLKEKFQEEDEQKAMRESKAPLFFSLPHQLHVKLHDLDTAPNSKQVQMISDVVDVLQKENTDTSANIIPEAEPLHTTDYFESQGIRLTEKDLDKDKMGKQLKSFTEWLKSMKKLPGGQPQIDLQKTDKKVDEMAEKSNIEAEVITETMAEIYIQQGKIPKAREVYEKLRLQNPEKNTYFASKLKDLI